MRPTGHGLLSALATIVLVAGGVLGRAHAQSTPSTSPVAPSADSARTASADLGPTSAPPWNPPAALSAVKPWESVLQLPGRVVTMPIAALGRVTRGSLLFIEGNNLVPRVIAVFAASPRIGIYAIPASLGDHTGTGVALEVRPPPLRGIIGGELSASTQHYHRTRIQLALGPLGAAYLYEWRSRDQFFGIGPDSKQDSLSEFAVQDQSIRANLTFPVQKPKQPPPRAQTSVYFGPRELVMRHGRGKKPSFEQ